MTTELLVSELVGNVVRHAKVPVIPRIRRASETDDGGRGLRPVAARSQRWGARYTGTGTCIWTGQALTGPESPAALLTFWQVLLSSGIDVP